MPLDADLRLLIGLPLSLLLLPRLFGLAATLLDRELRRGHGGILGLLASTLLEIVVTALVAPVMMLLHSRFVAEILLGRSSGWGPQRRDGDGEPFAQVLRAHAVHTALGIAAALAVGFASLEALAWQAPIVIGLTLAVPVSWLSGRESAGSFLHRLGLFTVPEEGSPPAVVAAVDREPGEGVWTASPERQAGEPARLAG